MAHPTKRVPARFLYCEELNTSHDFEITIEDSKNVMAMCMKCGKILDKRIIEMIINNHVNKR